MAKPIEILDPNYVLLSPGVLIHLRTRARLSLEDAVAQGIAREVEDPHEYYGRESVRALQDLAKADPAEVQGLVLGVVRKDTVGVYLIGIPEELRAAVVAMIEYLDHMDPQVPPDRSVH